MTLLTHPPVRFFILPGGKMPARQTHGAIGFDVYLRAIVSPTEMDPVNKVLRRALFDFTQVPRVGLLSRLRWLVGHRRPHFEPMHVAHAKDGSLVYRLMPGESVLVAVGFITEMKFPYFYWVSPRSGLASKSRITLGNAPGTVDPDYRGEAGVIVVNEGKKPFDLVHNMRIAQIIFQEAVIPEIEVVTDYAELEKSDRGPGGFGSTGTEDRK